MRDLCHGLVPEDVRVTGEWVRVVHEEGVLRVKSRKALSKVGNTVLMGRLREGGVGVAGGVAGRGRRANDASTLCITPPLALSTCPTPFPTHSDPFIVRT